ACCGAALVITNRGFRFTERALRWLYWQRSTCSRWFFQILRPAYPVRCSARRSLSSPELSRWCCTAHSFSSRPCDTETTSLQANPTTRKRTLRRHPITAAVSAGLLFAVLVAIVGLAKSHTPTLEIGVARLDVPKPVVGIVIAALVLLPEGLAALRAARANQLQTSLNLALGSALASIGLTIPVVAGV